MSYVLRNNGNEVGRSVSWNPHLFTKLTGTSFPSEVPDGWTWEQDGWTIASEVDQVDAPTPEQIIAKLTAAVQGWLDTEAQRKGYDDIVSACSYAGAPNPFQAESQQYVSWRGNVWADCYAIMADVQDGTRAIPTEAELLAELPACPVI